MTTDMFILYASWVLAALSLFFYTPKEKIRLAWVAFLFKQCITWPLGLFVVNIGWLQYPVRFFENANYTSFTFEFFVYPAISSLFITHFPNTKSIWISFGYYSLFCSAITAAELLLLHTTDLIRYIHWNGYFTWVSLFATLCMTRGFCNWFFKGYAPSSSGFKN